MRHGKLRTGFTTGTTAAAATKAALIALLTGSSPKEVNVLLPKGKVATLKVAWVSNSDSSVTCAVIKDGGDDPDVTTGAEICATVELTDNVGKIEIDGGVGVGRVTKQ